MEIRVMAGRIARHLGCSCNTEPRYLRDQEESARLDRFDLLVLDDLSYVRRDQAETSVLFELLAERYERKPWPSVSAEVRMTHCTELNLTHLGEHGGLLAVDVDPGASSGDTSDGPSGRRSSRDREAAGLLAQHGQALPA